MKIKKLFLKNIFFIFLLILLCQISYGYFYDINIVCENGVCISGERARWQITMENQGEQKMEILSIELVEAGENKTFGLYNGTYDPFSDDRGEFITLGQRSKKTVEIDAPVPDANNGSDLLYFVCFTRAIIEPTFAKEGLYDYKFCFDGELEKMDVIGCLSNDSCDFNEICVDSQCKEFQCKDCQFPFLHGCVNYECCSNEDCELTLSCELNKCVPVVCNPGEIFFNHSCFDLDCQYDEHFFMGKCMKLNCSKLEAPINHSCVFVDCAFDEEIADGKCQKLQCGEDEIPRFHECIKLDCEGDEVIDQHKCVKLSCNMLQVPSDHKCNLMWWVILKLISEVLVLAVLVFVLIIVIKKAGRESRTLAIKDGK